MSTSIKTIDELVEQRGYSFWDGEELDSPVLAFDTETNLVDLKTTIPDLVLMTISTNDANYVVKRSRVGDFVKKHQWVENWVGHNVSFDYWVILKHLRYEVDEETAQIWKEFFYSNSFKDTMHLDFLVRLAETKERVHLRARNLGDVAADYTNIEINKEDPYRLRFGELQGS